MRVAFFISIGFLLTNCSGTNHKISESSELDSLKQQIKNSYKPGLGEFMSTIQLHHGKLWFAGINENWELANFELNEIIESVDGIKQYCSDRPETKVLDKYLPPALSQIDQAIKQKDVSKFKEEFLILTSSCNDCHKTNSFGFNVVTIPNSPPVTNQDFRKVN